MINSMTANKKMLLPLCAALFLWNACSKDDDRTEEFSIIGVWSPSRKIVVANNGTTLSNTDYSACYKASTFDFRADNKMTSQIYDLNATLDCENLGSETVSYSYDHNAKKLVIDGKNVEVISRTNNELQFVDDYDDVDGDGIDEKIITVFVK